MSEQPGPEMLPTAGKPVNKIRHFIEFIVAFGGIIVLFGLMRYVSLKLSQH